MITKPFNSKCIEGKSKALLTLDLMLIELRTEYSALSLSLFLYQCVSCLVVELIVTCKTKQSIIEM